MPQNVPNADNRFRHIEAVLQAPLIGRRGAPASVPAGNFFGQGEEVAERRTHGAQTAAMLEGIERVLLQHRPRMLLVGGDANTNLAGALAARKLHIMVGHIEAGERSHDWSMPEEHNRVIIDHISDHLFATDELSARNLKRENVRGEIHIVGNPIVDASRQHLELAQARSDVLSRLGLTHGSYALLTSHREENVDNGDACVACYRVFPMRVKPSACRYCFLPIRALKSG